MSEFLELRPKFTQLFSVIPRKQDYLALQQYLSVVGLPARVFPKGFILPRVN